MNRPLALFLVLSAALASGAAFGGLPEKKQKNPGRADCAAPPSGSGAAGMAITEEGGPIQHADRPKPKPKGRMAAPGSGAAADTGSSAEARSAPTGPVRWTAPEADPHARLCP